ncbi:PAS domain-containing protein [Lichenihabitans psoromatis]|uniref:PAS domain-containing protein n=1 Tax=Lichenihabitans psoromatis TaxID=2528642 RepID=UPI00103636D6|nr:PAS domain-containing protein [Lichenihabitans psoromatis]
MQQKDDWHITDDLNYEHGQGDPFAAAMRATRMPMVISDPRQADNPIVFANEAFQALTGYDRHEIVGRNCRFLQGRDTDPQSVAELRAAIDAGRNHQVDLLNYRKDGSTFWNALYLSPVRGVDGDIQFFFASQLDVTERVDAQRLIAEQKAIVESEVRSRTADLEAALEAKTLLLHEVDHRVKNNLTMIGSLLRLQSRSIDDPVIVSKLDAMLERIDALATVHRRLYQSVDITRFDVGAFTQTLVADVIGASGRNDIALLMDVGPIDIPSTKATAFGLIVNEVVTNAVKHAFPNGRSGRLMVSARQDDTTGRISIVDDGPGLGGQELSGDGLGRTLISRLSKQIEATTKWEEAEPGTRVTITFPVAS